MAPFSRERRGCLCASQIADTAAGMSAEAAKEAGLPHPVQPIDICNKYAGLFQDLNKKLDISNDGYVRCGHPPQHGLPSDKMALITSDCDKTRPPEHQMALITSDCALFRTTSPEHKKTVHWVRDPRNNMDCPSKK